MEVFERVNLIIKKQKITKRAFSNILRSLEPKLKITGEVPSENTVYSYLTGRISIPIELIPYIADALHITEQELFDTTRTTRKRYCKYFINNAEMEELEQFNSLMTSKITNNINVKNGHVFMGSANLTEISIDEKLEKFKELLEFAPQKFLDKIIKKLEEYRKLEEDL